jgi:prephenate dehydratase
MGKYSKYHFNSVATLGNKLTCSCFAAERYFKNASIKLFDSFEDAAKAVKDGTWQALFVPGAYPGLRFLIMDDHLLVKETALIQIPALVTAGRFLKQPERIKRVYLHPAPESLLGEIEATYEEKIFVKSNPLACIEVLADETDSIAITNQNCAQFYGLNIYKILRSGIFMPFVIFVNA